MSTTALWSSPSCVVGRGWGGGDSRLSVSPQPPIAKHKWEAGSSARTFVLEAPTTLLTKRCAQATAISHISPVLGVSQQEASMQLRQKQPGLVCATQLGRWVDIYTQKIPATIPLYLPSSSTGIPSPWHDLKTSERRGWFLCNLYSQENKHSRFLVPCGEIKRPKFSSASANSWERLTLKLCSYRFSSGFLTQQFGRFREFLFGTKSDSLKWTAILLSVKHAAVLNK